MIDSSGWASCQALWLGPPTHPGRRQEFLSFSCLLRPDASCQYNMEGKLRSANMRELIISFENHQSLARQAQKARAQRFGPPQNGDCPAGVPLKPPKKGVPRKTDIPINGSDFGLTPITCATVERKVPSFWELPGNQGASTPRCGLFGWQSTIPTSHNVDLFLQSFLDGSSHVAVLSWSRFW